MNRIPPNERFSHREAALAISVEEVSAAAKFFLGADAPLRAERLSGGYSNANFLVEQGSARRLLRFFPAGKETAEREVKVLGLARSHGVRVPGVFASAQINGHSVMLEEFLPGELLARVLERAERVREPTFEVLGRELAKIHSVRFERAGIFKSEGALEPLPEDAGLFFIRQFLAGRAGERLGPAKARAVLELAESRWSAVRETESTPVLVHCDFNPKNILVGEAEVTGILDWEFAIAAHPLIDLGNFFRFSDDYTPAESDAFLRGYASAGGWLPQDWRLASRLLDLVAMCSFLASEEEYPKSFRTAHAVIEETLETF